MPPMDGVKLPWDPVALEAAARERLPDVAYAYYAAGAGLETTVAANPRAWERWWLRPRVLVDVATVSTATTVLGTAVRLPVLLAPCAFHRLAHPDAEAATARAAAAAGTVMIVSTHSSLPLEEVVPHATAGAWFQLYCDPDPEVTAARVKAHFGELVRGDVERFEAGNVLALKFVMHGALGGGAPRSLRSDNLGKTHAATLLRMWIDVPDPVAAGARRRQRAPLPG